MNIIEHFLSSLGDRNQLVLRGPTEWGLNFSPLRYNRHRLSFRNVVLEETQDEGRCPE